MSPAEKLGHRARANRVNTAIGSAWQASCSCGWEGRRYFTKGAADVARAERWSHEIDVEDRERESSDPSTKENDRDR